MQQKLVIPSRFCGPDGSANGGYCCGLLAAHIKGSTAQTRLMQPPPLDQELILRKTGSSIRLLSGDEEIAVAKPTELELALPEPVSTGQAIKASRNYRGFAQHLYPHCFVCGPQRDQGDGLRIFAGSLRGTELVAAPWVAEPQFADNDGNIKPEIIWAALDCPGYFSFQNNLSMLLGQFSVKILHPLKAGQQTVICGWPIAVEGRKHLAGTALFVDGKPIAYGQSLWIQLA